MTEEKVLQLLAEIATMQKENTKDIKKLQQSQDRTDKQLQQTDKEIQEMRKTLKGLGLNVDGINKSIGLEAEEFFYSSLKQQKKLNKIQFDHIFRNIKVTDGKGKDQEIDILLTNGSYVAIIEVKNKVSQKNLEQLKKIENNFLHFHPQFKDYKIIPVIAGKIFSKHLKDKFIKSGFTVLTQVGNHIEEYGY